ncbi:MAG: hypothetical protein IPN34_16170 [Planctomycetes bacterium]|nr:hypothetical protein [Planctomycetota bacterium]
MGEPQLWGLEKARILRLQRANVCLSRPEPRRLVPPRLDARSGLRSVYVMGGLEPWLAREHVRLAVIVVDDRFRGQAQVSAIRIRSPLDGVPARAPSTLLECYPTLRAHARPASREAPAPDLLSGLDSS